MTIMELRSEKSAPGNRGFFSTDCTAWNRRPREVCSRSSAGSTQPIRSDGDYTIVLRRLFRWVAHPLQCHPVLQPNIMTGNDLDCLTHKYAPQKTTLNTPRGPRCFED